MEHIKECFKWLIEVDEFTDVDYDLIKMAIIFHDCYYTVMPRKEGDASNEIISATISRDWMKKFLLPEQFIKKVEFLIESTEKHLPITTDDKSIETDCKIFLDIDLSILGADPKRYDHYAHQIREEYSFVHDGAYNPARTKILQGFLDRKEIYFTNFFIERLESQARDNIEREIANLKK
jgi:predicted metal-dependent HD superfamily phosphohydrolase